MRKVKSVKHVQEICQAAFQEIENLSLPCIPEIYELWYSYFAKENPELTHDIDNYKRNGGALDLAICQDLYKKYISTEDEVNNVRAAGSKIQTTINSVNTLVEDVHETTSQYSNSLNDLNEQLSEENYSADELKGIVQNISQDTTQILEKNHRLEEELSKQASVMLDLQRDLNRVRQEAMTDGLTNISNRKAFDIELATVIERYGKVNEDLSTFSLVLMDIDHFKSFNDNYGHQIGDQVLRLVAKTLVECIKGRDFAARYGGEEFALILPETDQHSAQKLANTLRETVANKQVVNRNTGKKLGRITLSGGVTEFYSGDEETDLIQRADKALYSAKENGRNMISLAKINVARS